MTRGMPFKWPADPYKGLNYFRPPDPPLLAGRDEDVAACSAVIAHPQTRVLLLHGSTGCGKSSFIRAGLIPVMEEDGAGYLFLRVHGGDDEALFIRCTDAPIDQMARQIYLFAIEPFSLRTPTGVRNLDLRPALLGAADWEAYLTTAREDHCLVESLRQIAEIIPQTLVLIVDQAEEIITLNPGEANAANRFRFFRFLREFQTLEFDVRVIVTLRTEYFGRFIDATQISHHINARFQQFLLVDLPRLALIEAIVRPTRRNNVGQFGVPSDTYNFSYDPLLPERIVDEILNARYSGPPLAVLQLVCQGLYQNARRREQEARVVIDSHAYAGKGGIEGQVIAHIEKSVRVLYHEETAFLADIGIIRMFLGSFYSIQEDGSVVARTLDSAWVISDLSVRGLSVSPTKLYSILASPQTMILRQLRNVKGGGHVADEVTLGHDSVALALERWRALDAVRRADLAEKERNRRIGELTLEYGLKAASWWVFLAANYVLAFIFLTFSGEFDFVIDRLAVALTVLWERAGVPIDFRGFDVRTKRIAFGMVFSPVLIYTLYRNKQWLETTSNVFNHVLRVYIRFFRYVLRLVPKVIFGGVRFCIYVVVNVWGALLELARVVGTMLGRNVSKCLGANRRSSSGD